jgi:hypothetical protein
VLTKRVVFLSFAACNDFRDVMLRHFMSVLCHGNQGKVLMFLDNFYMRIYPNPRTSYFITSNSTSWFRTPVEESLSGRDSFRDDGRRLNV